MDRFRFLQDNLNDWYLVPEENVKLFIRVKMEHEHTPEYCRHSMRSEFGKYKLMTSVESCSFVDPQWEE